MSKLSDEHDVRQLVRAMIYIIGTAVLLGVWINHSDAQPPVAIGFSVDTVIHEHLTIPAEFWIPCEESEYSIQNVNTGEQRTICPPADTIIDTNWVFPVVVPETLKVHCPHQSFTVDTAIECYTYPPGHEATFLEFEQFREPGEKQQTYYQQYGQIVTLICDTVLDTTWGEYITP